MSGIRPRDNPLDCPKCGGRMACVDTRPSRFMAQQSVSRRRQCEKCRYRLSTIEVERSALDRARSLTKLTAEIEAAAAKLDAAMIAVRGYLASPDEYDGQRDLAGSLDEGYRAVRERAGGPGWKTGAGEP